MSYLGDNQRERTARGEASFGNSLLGLSSATKPGRATHYTRDNRGALISQRSPEGRQYYLSDSLGSVVGLTRQSGAIANRYRYDPFGNTMSEGTAEGVSNPFKFGGEFYDSEIGLYKQGLRFYDPKLGRWTQKDPLDQVTEPRQSNRYAFAAQDAVNLTDPSGAISIDPGRALTTGLELAYIGLNSYGLAKAAHGAAALGPVLGPPAFAAVAYADYEATDYLYSKGAFEGSYLPHDQYPLGIDDPPNSNP